MKMFGKFCPVSPGKLSEANDGCSCGAPCVAAPTELADHPDYELVRELRRDQTGRLYLARNRLLDRLEALRVVEPAVLDTPRAMERLKQEVRVAAKLAHPNLVTIYGLFRIGQQFAIATEYVEGQALAEVVAQRGALPVADACFYAYQVAQGLQHFLDVGMVHRSIGPSSLMLSISGTKHVVKISDFSLASPLSKSNPATKPSGSGQFLGVPDFIAPEQTLDADDVDIRGDIYCLGCTLYFLLSGGPPFQGTSLYEILEAHHTHGPRSLSLVRHDVPPELAAVVAMMMAKDRANRFQAPVEVSHALLPFVKPTHPAPARPLDRGASAS